MLLEGWTLRDGRCPRVGQLALPTVSSLTTTAGAAEHLACMSLFSKNRDIGPETIYEWGGGVCFMSPSELKASSLQARAQCALLD